jgi:threonine aldolase
MANAEVGDDVFGEDPTVRKLQERVAKLLGKEAALFVPSGTMANQVALAAQTRHGDEILLDENSHLINYESGAPALLSGLQLRTLPGNRGHLTPELIEGVARSGGMSHFAPQSLIEVENTHNRSGGTVYTQAELADLRKSASKHGMKLHLDGARLWNAAVSLGCSESDLARYADSVSVCFSKGMGAPVGSAVAGSLEFIQRAHRYRKAFGGGMRQAGVLAAAALYAIDHNRSRLIEDHQNADRLAERLRECKFLQLDDEIQTNIIVVHLQSASKTAPELVDECARSNVLFFAEDVRRIRLVTHLDFSAEKIDFTANTIISCMERD